MPRYHTLTAALLGCLTDKEDQYCQSVAIPSLNLFGHALSVLFLKRDEVPHLILKHRDRVLASSHLHLQRVHSRDVDVRCIQMQCSASP